VKELDVRSDFALADNSMLGVYVSVPFCRAKCSFCNFASGVGTPAAMERYVQQLCKEIDAAANIAAGLGAELPRVVDTVYLGGGTPSLLSPEQLSRIFAALRRNFDVAEDAEITLEAAPGQIADDVSAAAMELGVNRVSLGVQSFVDKECASVGRLHTERECVEEIRRLRAAGIAEVGADLIAGLPYQTMESWEHSLAVATGLGADGSLTHLSVYMLEVDEDSRLGQEVIAGGKRFHAHGVPAEQISADLYERACEVLPRAGFLQYEISNFAAAEHRSRHNVKYWKRAPYMGFGLDAHSMLLSNTGAVRFANPDELQEYGLMGSTLKPVRVGEREALEETLFLGLRMNEGISIGELRERFPRETVESCEQGARELIDEGLMCEQAGRWRLTLRGRLVSNDVFGHLLEERDAISVH
jgi:oxygen-independent coproporphyrinogen-3 oxidase